MEKLKKLFTILEKYLERKFYGDVVITFRNGKPEKIRKEVENILI